MSFANLSVSVTQAFSPNSKIIYQNPDLINLNTIHGDAIIISNGLAYFIRDHQFLSHTGAEKNDAILLTNHKTMALTVNVDKRSIKSFLSELFTLAIRYEESSKDTESAIPALEIVENLRIAIWLDMRTQIKKLITMPEIKERANEPATTLRKLIAWEFSEERINQAEGIIHEIVVRLTVTNAAKSTTHEECAAPPPKSTIFKENDALALIKAISENAKLINSISAMLAPLATRQKNKKKELEEFKTAMKKNKIFPLIFYQILQIIDAISPEEITIDNYRGILAGANTLCMKYNQDAPVHTSDLADQLHISRRLLCHYEHTVANLINFRIPFEEALIDELTGKKKISSVIETILETINPQKIIPTSPQMIPLLIPAIIQQLENKEKILLIQEINAHLASAQRLMDENFSREKFSNDLVTLLSPRNFIQRLFETNELPEDKLHRFLSSDQTPTDFQARCKALLDYFNKSAAVLPLRPEDIRLLIINTIDDPLLIQQFLQKILADKQAHLIAALMDCFQIEACKKIIFSALENSASLTLVKTLFDQLITILPAQNEALVKLTILDNTGDCATIYLKKFPGDTACLGMIAIAHADKSNIVLHIKSVIGFRQLHPDDLIALYLKLDALRHNEVNSHNAKVLLSGFSDSDYSRMLASTNVDNLSTLFANASFKTEIMKEGKLEAFCFAIIKHKFVEQLSCPLFNTEILTNYSYLLTTILEPMIAGTRKSNNIGLLISQYQLISQKIQENLTDEHPYSRELKTNSAMLTTYFIKNSFLQPIEPSDETVSPPTPEIKSPLKLKI